MNAKGKGQNGKVKMKHHNRKNYIATNSLEPEAATCVHELTRINSDKTKGFYICNFTICIFQV